MAKNKVLTATVLGFSVGVAAGIAVVSMQSPRVKDKTVRMVEDVLDLGGRVLIKASDFVGEIHEKQVLPRIEEKKNTWKATLDKFEEQQG